MLEHLVSFTLITKLGDIHDSFETDIQYLIDTTKSLLNVIVPVGYYECIPQLLQSLLLKQAMSFRTKATAYV